ncbi:hypothetical protein [Crateriforma conspicua]|uniref:hypothetical protein n=1 Tax=Crateriforma conspicua TaxID=2527996 RepID=UPI001E4B60A8|nr:hypothetical protein [Crateriforma conspicua]
MSIGKAHATSGKPINVWRDRTRARLKTSDKIVHVVDRQKHDIGSRIRRNQLANTGCGKYNDAEKKTVYYIHKFHAFGIDFL